MGFVLRVVEAPTPTGVVGNGFRYRYVGSLREGAVAERLRENARRMVFRSRHLRRLLPPLTRSPSRRFALQNSRRLRQPSSEGGLRLPCVMGIGDGGRRGIRFAGRRGRRPLPALLEAMLDIVAGVRCAERHSFCGSSRAFSLRLGPAAVLTCHRHVIHYRVDALGDPFQSCWKR